MAYHAFLLIFTLQKPKMRIPRTAILLALIGFVACEDKNDDTDTSNAFMEAAQALFADKDAVGGLQNIASKFMESDAGKQVDSSDRFRIFNKSTR